MHVAALHFASEAESGRPVACRPMARRNCFVATSPKPPPNQAWGDHDSEVSMSKVTYPMVKRRASPAQQRLSNSKAQAVEELPEKGAVELAFLLQHEFRRIDRRPCFLIGPL